MSMNRVATGRLVGKWTCGVCKHDFVTREGDLFKCPNCGTEAGPGRLINLDDYPFDLPPFILERVPSK